MNPCFQVVTYSSPRWHLSTSLQGILRWLGSYIHVNGWTQLGFSRTLDNRENIWLQPITFMFAQTAIMPGCGPISNYKSSIKKYFRTHFYTLKPDGQQESFQSTAMQNNPMVTWENKAGHTPTDFHSTVGVLLPCFPPINGVDTWSLLMYYLNQQHPISVEDWCQAGQQVHREEEPKDPPFSLWDRTPALIPMTCKSLLKRREVQKTSLGARKPMLSHWRHQKYSNCK